MSLRSKSRPDLVETTGSFGTSPLRAQTRADMVLYACSRLLHALTFVVLPHEQRRRERVPAASGNAVEHAIGWHTPAR
jgi:hypothetical protein